MIMIEVAGLEKNFKDLKVLDGISFSINKGRATSILGPSGCGKSTLLRILAGLVAHDKGTVKIKAANIGIMFQEPRLLQWRTVKQNISLGLELKGMPVNEKKIDHLLELVGLLDYSHYYPHKLSGGMKQRVALARTLASEPDVLLMDEPLSSLDHHTRKDLQEKILHIQEKNNLTTVFVTHSIEESRIMGDETIILSQKPTVIENIVRNR